MVVRTRIELFLLLSVILGVTSAFEHWPDYGAQDCAQDPDSATSLCATNSRGDYKSFTNQCQFNRFNAQQRLHFAPEWILADPRHCRCSSIVCNTEKGKAFHHPVCAYSTDTYETRTFASECELNKHNCYTQQNWNLISHEPCGSSDPLVPASNENSDHLDPYRTTVCAAGPFGRRTFANIYAVYEAEMHTGQDWTVIGNGPCSYSSLEQQQEAPPPAQQPRVDLGSAELSLAPIHHYETGPVPPELTHLFDEPDTAGEYWPAFNLGSPIPKPKYTTSRPYPKKTYRPSRKPYAYSTKAAFSSSSSKGYPSGKQYTKSRTTKRRFYHPSTTKKYYYYTKTSRRTTTTKRTTTKKPTTTTTTTTTAHKPTTTTTQAPTALSPQLTTTHILMMTMPPTTTTNQMTTTQRLTTPTAATITADSTTTTLQTTAETPLPMFIRPAPLRAAARRTNGITSTQLSASSTNDPPESASRALKVALTNPPTTTLTTATSTVPSTVPKTVASTTPTTVAASSVPTTVESTVPTSFASTVTTSVASTFPTTFKSAALTTVESPVPTTKESTVATTVGSSLPTTVESPVPTTAESTVPTTAEPTVPTTVESTVPTTAESTVPTTTESTVPITVESTLPTTAESTVPTTAESTVPTTAESTVPTTVEATVPTIVEATVPTTFDSTVPTTAEATVPTTVDSTLPRTAESTVPTTVESSVPTTVESTVPTVVTFVPQTEPPIGIITDPPTTPPTVVPSDPTPTLPATNSVTGMSILNRFGLPDRIFESTRNLPSTMDPTRHTTLLTEGGLETTVTREGERTQGPTTKSTPLPSDTKKPAGFPDFLLKRSDPLVAEDSQSKNRTTKPTPIGTTDSPLTTITTINPPQDPTRKPEWRTTRTSATSRPSAAQATTKPSPSTQKSTQTPEPQAITPTTDTTPSVHETKSNKTTSNPCRINLSPHTPVVSPPLMYPRNPLIHAGPIYYQPYYVNYYYEPVHFPYPYYPQAMPMYAQGPYYPRHAAYLTFPVEGVEIHRPSSEPSMPVLLRKLADVIEEIDEKQYGVPGLI